MIQLRSGTEKISFLKLLCCIYQFIALNLEDTINHEDKRLANLIKIGLLLTFKKSILKNQRIVGMGGVIFILCLAF